MFGLSKKQNQKSLNFGCKFFNGFYIFDSKLTYIQKFESLFKTYRENQNCHTIFFVILRSFAKF